MATSVVPAMAGTQGLAADALRASVSNALESRLRGNDGHGSRGCGRARAARHVACAGFGTQRRAAAQEPCA